MTYVHRKKKLRLDMDFVTRSINLEIKLSLPAALTASASSLQPKHHDILFFVIQTQQPVHIVRAAQPLKLPRLMRS